MTRALRREFARLSIAKTGTPLLSVTIATVSRVGRLIDSDGWQLGRSGVRTCSLARLRCVACTARSDEVTSSGASFVAMVQAADFWKCDHLTVGDRLYGSRRRRVFRQ